MWFLVTGEDFEDHAAAGLFQHVLKDLRVTPHLFSVHLFDDVTHMQQALLVYHAPVQDPSNHQLSTLHPKRHALAERTESISFFVEKHFIRLIHIYQSLV